MRTGLLLTLSLSTLGCGGQPTAPDDMRFASTSTSRPMMAAPYTSWARRRGRDGWARSRLLALPASHTELRLPTVAIPVRILLPRRH